MRFGNRWLNLDNLVQRMPGVRPAPPSGIVPVDEAAPAVQRRLLQHVCIHDRPTWLANFQRLAGCGNVDRRSIYVIGYDFTNPGPYFFHLNELDIANEQTPTFSPAEYAQGEGTVRNPAKSSGARRGADCNAEL